LSELRQRLFARSARPSEPGFALQVTAVRGGERRVLRPDRLAAARWWFAVPIGSTALRLTSGRHVPLWTDAASLDARELGVSISAVEINGIELSLDSPLLAEGWHACEGAAGHVWRWTDGDAVLALPEGALTVVLATPDRFEEAMQAVA
jgi:hypothetical protein